MIRHFSLTVFVNSLILLVSLRSSKGFIVPRYELHKVSAFGVVIVEPRQRCAARSFIPLTSLWQSQNDETITDELRPASEMKLREIQSELKERGVSYADCFDRDSLTKRLGEARSGKVSASVSTSSKAADSDEKKGRCEPKTEQQDRMATNTPSAPQAPSSTAPFDREAVVAELRSLRVAELRKRLSARNIRWANMLEKQDLVNALADSMEASSHFSPSGKLSPGEVADVTDKDLSVELEAGAATTPLLLDVYATWCGPCQMVAPQMKMAAAELGDTVRVAKIDSDKFPEFSSKHRVGGLPTLLVFDGTTGEVVERVEGALMKDQLVELARRHL